MDIRVLASGSGGNATIISDDETTLMFDAGLSLQDIRKKSGWALIDGVFVTHAHMDHAKGVKELARFGTDVYASAGAFSALGMDGHRSRTVKHGEMVFCQTFGVTAFDVVHDADEPLGFIAKSGVTMESAVYFSDTAYVRYKIGAPDYIIAECNHGEEELRQSVGQGVIDAALAARIAKSHMSVERLVKLLKANDLSRLKAVHLIHLSGNNSNAERFKTLVQQATGAEVYVH